MKVTLIKPAQETAGSGNGVTALRYSRILRGLGHQTSIADSYDGAPCDLLIALHAQKSAGSIARFRKLHPGLPLIVVLTGTDLYRDIRINAQAMRSLELADRLVVLQRLGLDELTQAQRAKTRVIYQSAVPMGGAVSTPSTYFKVAVIGNLRREKDPLRAALAARLLPADSRARVLHAGRAMNGAILNLATKETESNPRYRWVGDLPYWRARRLLASSHLLALTSRMEGSSNVLCEAIVSSVPVVASAIPGLMGTLGEDYPGYFPVGDAGALSCLIARAERDRDFYREIKSRCVRLAPVLAPSRERDAWRRLINETLHRGFDSQYQTNLR